MDKLTPILTPIMKVIDYCFVLNADEEEHARQVKALLKKGWQPWGAPMLQNGHGELSNYEYIIQAMVKYKPS